MTDLVKLTCHIAFIAGVATGCSGSPIEGRSKGYIPSSDAVRWTSVLRVPPGSNGLDSPVGAMAIDPQNSQILYAGTAGSGLFKSIDGGASWNYVPIDSGPEAQYVGLLAIHPQEPGVLYAITGIGFLMSWDGGASWQSPGYVPYGVHAWAFDPMDPRTIYLATEGNGVVKSTDGGTTWGASGLSELTVTSLAIDPKAPHVLYAGTAGRGVFKSEDGGSSWKAINGGLGNDWVYALAIHPQQSDVIYAGTGSRALKSRDGGANWYGVLGGFYVHSIVINALRPHVVYTGTDGDGVLMSTDGGEYWSLINDGLDDPGIYTLAIDPGNSDVLYAGSKSGQVLKGTVRRNP